MCRNATQFEGEIPFEIKERLMPLLADELIELNGSEIIVTEIGKSFLRNISMAFDERLWKNQPETKIFSSAI